MDLYIGNLPINLDSEGLKKLVEFCASVQKSKIIKANGVSKGFGVVTVSDTDAMTIIKGLNRKIWEGKRLSVKRAYPEKKKLKHPFISRKWREKTAEKV